MLDWTRLRPPSGTVAFVRLGVELGVDEETLLQGSGLSPDLLRRGDALVSGVQEVQVVRNLQAALPQMEHLGLMAGKRMPLTYYGMLGLAWASSASLTDSLALTLRYRELTYSMLEASDTEVVAGWFGCHLMPLTLPRDVQDFHVQFAVSALITTARDILAIDRFETQARFTQSAPTTSEAHEAFLEILGTIPVFDAASDWVAYPVDLLATPLPYASPYTLRVALASIEDELAAARARNTRIGQVSARILARLRDGASVNVVARDLLVSPRTLRRQLQLEGTSYRDLLDTVRAREAERLLRDSGLSVAQIATTLGYANPPAFTAAFRRWHRITPVAFRHGAAAA